MSLTKLLIYSIFFVLFIGALWRPILGILGYLAIYLIYNPGVWWGNTLTEHLPRPSFTAMVFLLIGSIIHFRNLNWSFSRREFEFYIFLGFICLSSLVFGVGMDVNNWFYLTNMVKLFVFIFFFIRVINSLDDYKKVIWLIIFGVIFLSYQSHTIGGSYIRLGRLDSLGSFDFAESNSIAAVSALGITFLAIEMLRSAWWKKLMYLFGIALMLNTIIMTQSRGVFLSIILTIPYIIFRAPSEKRKQVYIALILGIVLFFMLTDIKFLVRMDTISVPLENYQEEKIDRLEFWKASIPMFKDHPFGIGIKNFEKYVPSYDPRNKGMDPHNTFVMCYSEIGFLGITLFLIIIIEALLQLRRIRLMVMNTIYYKDVTLYSFALGIAFIIYLTGYGMTHSILYKEILWILLSMPICLENAVRRLLLQIEYSESSHRIRIIE